MADMSPTNEFIQTLSQTPGLATQLQGNLQKLKDDLDEIIKVLGYTKTVADDLDELVSALTTTSELLSFVAVIPEVGEAVTPVKEAVDALLAEVKPAKDAADKLEAMVKPFREALQKLGPVLDDMIKACGEISSTAQSFLNTFTCVTSCIDSLPDGQYKSDAQNYLNQFSSSAQPYVDALNTALRTTNDAITTFYAALQTLEDALNPLAALAQAIEAVTSTLQPLLDLLNQLSDALKSIKIPTLLPYPTEISLYDAFKYFGDLIDEAMKPIQGLVDDLLKALNIQLPSIPGLDQLYQLLNLQLPSIPDFSALLNAILQPFQQLEAWIAKFSLKCPPGPGDTVPTL
jgi:uncharacterized phage infection (PIP) family protein YhgE